MTHKSTDPLAEAFTQLVEEAKRDPNIVALWLDGSRGKGVNVTEQSDYDVRIIVKENVIDAYQEKYKRKEKPGLDLNVMPETYFERYAEYGTPYAWDRYNFAHLKALVDKTGGKIQQLINAKGCVSLEDQRKIIPGCLDAFVNQVYRAAKCWRDGNPIAARLEAAEAISPLLTAMFALHGRVKPYYKYLQWELNTYPLDKFPWNSKTLISLLLRILEQGNTELLIDLLKAIRPIFREAGYNQIFDEWKGDYLVGDE